LGQDSPLIHSDLKNSYQQFISVTKPVGTPQGTHSHCSPNKFFLN